MLGFRRSTIGRLDIIMTITTSSDHLENRPHHERRHSVLLVLILMVVTAPAADHHGDEPFSAVMVLQQASGGLGASSSSSSSLPKNPFSWQGMEKFRFSRPPETLGGWGGWARDGDAIPSSLLRTFSLSLFPGHVSCLPLTPPETLGTRTPFPPHPSPPCRSVSLSLFSL
jgi:hypothetical protein